MKRLPAETLRSFIRHNGTLLGGATAFFALLSAAPLLVLVLAMAAPVVGRAAARAELLHGMQLWLGDDGAATIALLLDNMRAHHRGPAVGIFSVLVLTYGATRLFSQLQRALNHLWDVEARPGKGFRRVAWRQLRRRALSFVMVLLCGAFLLATVLVRTGLTAATNVLGTGMPEVWHLVDHALTFLVVLGLFALLFKVLPDVRLAWRDALAGALVSTLLFHVGKVVVGLYLGRRGQVSAFGAAGSLVLLLLWVHYSAQAFFLGAAFTEAYARLHGRPLRPGEGAVRIHVEEEA